MIVDPACNITQGFCSAVLGGTRLQLRIGPGVSALKPFPIQVRAEGVDKEKVRNVIVSYSMKGMDMGPNRTTLKPTTRMQWEGSSVLPVCTSGRSDWLAEVQLIEDKRLLSARFAFTLKGPMAQ